MRARLALFALIALAACGTPQEQCINRESRELRTVERLIAEVEGNLARGYAYEEYEVPVRDWDPCGVREITLPDGTVKHKTVMCLETRWETRERKVAIDPEAEKRKLAGLQAKRKELLPKVDAAITACKQAYPE
ncbi:MAG: hypothetical protein R3D78_14655 [Paracoccaceae bacterium]|uniref:Lipoprotein n=1 Tax=Pseudothioclava arenosa TaxID=1795308 RepID=A0A2A4CQ00_9RHOB|nr:hypothetical protein [Pseudothioclava arenosa]PCD78053.1 hypothetical protein CLN94_01735 [Pseudothioclava arenosa]